MKLAWLLALTMSAGAAWANHHSDHEHEKSADHAHHDEHGHDEHGHDEHGHDEHEGHDHSTGIHQHGVSRLEAAFDGAVFQAQLTAPMVDWVGFEHVTNNEAQRAALADAKAFLQDGGIALIGGDCELGSVTFQGFDLDKMKDSDHLDLSAFSTWNCKAPRNVTGLNVSAFEHFPGMLSVDAAVITSNGQFAAELKADRPTLEMAN